MSCNNYKVLISAAVDGELTPAERKLLDGHLAECPGCRDELALFQGAGRLLRAPAWW